MTSRAILAIDLGTTQAKAGLIGLDGRLFGLAREAYPLHTDASTGAAEQDPEDWWTAIQAMTAELLASSPPVEIVAIGIDGQGPTLVTAAADGRPVRRAITWLDTRSAAEEADLLQATGEAGWVLGILPKALWVERHDRAALADARWHLASWEWVGLRLTGVAAETSLPGQVHPDRAMAARTGLAMDRLPGPVASATVLGALLAGPAAELGLAPGIPVAAGMADAHASFVGAGLTEPGDAIDTGGTSGGFAVYTDRPLAIPGVFGAAAPIPGRWFLGGAMNATGKALDWLRDEVLADDSTDRLVADALAVEPGADGLLFLPYLSGERSPIWDPTARGAFVGLTLRHGRAHLARAVLEAADLALRHVAAPIVAAGVPVRELRVSGGLARDPGLNRLKADVTGFPVAVPVIVETATAGSAIAAGTAIGAFPDLVAGIHSVVQIDERIEPDPDRRATYDATYTAYVALYPALRSSFHRLAEQGANETSGSPAGSGGSG